MAAVREHERALGAYLLEAVGEVPGLIVHGPQTAEQRGAVFSLGFPDIHPHDVGTVLDAEGVAIRAGHHCCQPLMRRLDVAATARASLYVYNTRAEIDTLVRALCKVPALFRRAAARV